MILQALLQLAEREGLVDDPDFQPALVSWLVVVSREGRITGIVDNRERVPGKGQQSERHVARSIPVPIQRKRQGTKPPPYFCVDNAKYVFGVVESDEPKKQVEARERAGWFHAQLAACAQATGDEAVVAVVHALERWAAGERDISLPEDCRSNDLFAFVFEPDVDRFLHQRSLVERFWRDQRSQTSPYHEKRQADALQCVVTGEPVSVPALFPAVKRVPGGQSAGASLVSFNASAFESYGLRRSENAPMSRATAEAVGTALRRLVEPSFPNPRATSRDATLPRRHLRIGNDTLVCFWSSSADGDAFVDVFGSIFDVALPDQVAQMYHSLWRGVPAPIADAGAFYALTISGAQGRIIVRDWLESSIGRVNQNVARYFEDLALVRNSPSAKGVPPSPHLPLRVLMSSLSPFGREDRIPAPHLAAFVHAVLEGSRLPIAVLQRAVERARAECGGDKWGDFERRDARAMLIKAVLRRTYNLQLTPTMDESNTNPGYLCGRLLAVLERLQQAALGDVNASIIDRYFGAASATPRVVFVRLMRNAAHHARKAADEAKSARTARWLKRTIDEITANFSAAEGGFPAYLSLEQQGLFILGYHQQRHTLWTRRAEPDDDAAAATAASAA